MALSDFSSNPYLREFATGIAEEQIVPIADFLAPTVNVSAATGHYKAYTVKNRFRLPDTIRPPGGRAVRVFFDATDATYNCKPNAVDVPWDMSEIDEAADGGMNLMKESAGIAAGIGRLSHERDAINLALTTLGAGTDINVQGVDAVDAILAEVDALALAATGGSTMQTRILFGPTAWRRFAGYARAKFVLVGSKTAIFNLTPPDAEGLFLGDTKIMVSRSALDTTPEGQTPSMEYLLDNSLIIFFASQNPTRMDPSFMKTFRLAGAWLGPGTYTSEDGRGEVAKFDWSHDVKVTNTLAAVRLNLTSVAP